MEQEKIQRRTKGGLRDEYRGRMRENLKRARKAVGLTQEALAEALSISHNYYQKIEDGSRNGNFKIWDALEDITGVHQRILRASSENHPGKEENR